jgi:hypothetical protein
MFLVFSGPEKPGFWEKTRFLVGVRGVTWVTSVVLRNPVF